MASTPTKWQEICATVNSPDWRDLLRDLNAEVLANEEIVEDLPLEQVESSWLGSPGATIAKVEAAERRIGRSLPASYRAFLVESNGWHCLNSFQVQLLPADKIGWLRDLDPHMVEIWNDFPEDKPLADEVYFTYNAEQPDNQPQLRAQHIRDMLMIADGGWSGSEAVWPNPRAISPDGEWEAWSFSPGDGDGTRYRSFWDLMLLELRMRIHNRSFPI